MNQPNLFLIQRKALARFRKKIPFLRLIPDEIYHSLDPTSWYEPFGEIETVRLKIEEVFNCYVMTYNTNFEINYPPEHQLDARVLGAELSKKQWKLLFAYWDKFTASGIVFVTYAKSLKFVPLNEVLRHPCDPEEYERHNYEVRDEDIPF